MAKVPQSIALGHAVDETSSRATWHIPRAHYLESWGDARAVGGTLSVIQPLILPLFGGRTSVEVLGLVVGARNVPATTSCGRPGNRSWARPSSTGSGTACCMMACYPGASFQKSFHAQREPFAELARPIGAGAAGSRRANAGISGGWRSCSSPSPSLHDGRFANDQRRSSFAIHRSSSGSCLRAWRRPSSGRTERAPARSAWPAQWSSWDGR